MTKTALDLTEDERDTYHLAYPPQSGERVTPPEIDMRTCEQPGIEGSSTSNEGMANYELRIRELRIANCEFGN